jgi:hypothetical protein
VDVQHEAPRARSYALAVGYAVDVLGQVVLIDVDETAVVSSLRLAMLESESQGWLTDDTPVASLAELGPFVCAEIGRTGRVLTFEPLDYGFDSKWSAQASAFYVELARWVISGEIEAEGADGSVWSYHYLPMEVSQLGTNAWDGAGPRTITLRGHNDD